MSAIAVVTLDPSNRCVESRPEKPDRDIGIVDRGGVVDEGVGATGDAGQRVELLVSSQRAAEQRETLVHAGQADPGLERAVRASALQQGKALYAGISSYSAAASAARPNRKNSAGTTSPIASRTTPTAIAALMPLATFRGLTKP